MSDGKAEVADGAAAAAGATSGKWYVTDVDAVAPIRDFDPSKPGTDDQVASPSETVAEKDARLKQLTPTTFPAMFAGTAKKHAARDALAVERDGAWKTWTWAQYEDESRNTARALVKCGLERFGAVAILGFNSPEWFQGFVGATFAGGVACGIYATNGPEAVLYVISHSDAQVILVENTAQCAKLVAIADQLPARTSIKTVVQWLGEPEADAKATLEKNGVERVLSWAEFQALGQGEDKDALAATCDKRVEETLPAHCASIIYTSGTTGNPKGVMLSHDNLTWTARVTMDLIRLGPQDVGVSYLPLSHVAAQMLDIGGPANSGAKCYFARPDALQGTLVETLKVARPTMFLGVPRVWDKIYEKMRALGKSTTGAKKSIADWAKGVGSAGVAEMQQKRTMPWGWWLANTLVFNNIKEALGLDRCHFFASGAAPLAREVSDYFASLNMPIREIYGMSESTGPQTLNTVEDFQLGCAGIRMAGTRMKIADDGEIVYQGRNVFMGYLKQPDVTAEAIDDEGWLHSGDIGSITGELEWLAITGRKKELLITAGGENIAPVLIEDQIKVDLGELISNVMVVGDRQKFLACVVTLRAAPIPPTELETGDYPFTDELAPSAVAFLAARGVGEDEMPKTIKDAIANQKVHDIITDGIKSANTRAISRAHNVQKFCILERDFTLEGGELTPSMKLKRRIVYDAQIDAIKDVYGEHWAE